MISFGNVPLGAVLPIPFATYGKTNGESITLTGLAVTDVEIYKGTTVTQRSSDAGYALIDTDGIDIDGITGIHAFSIDTGDNTDAGFYVAGSFYYVVVSAVTVDSQTVNFIAATFRIVAAESVAGVVEVDVTHFNGTAGTFSGGRPEVNTTHAAGTAWGSGAITAASIADNAIDAGAIAADAITAAKIADGAIDAATFAASAITSTVLANDAITAAKLHADVTTELQSGLATAAALATVDGIVDDILLDTAEIGAAGAGLTNLATAANLATVAGYLDTEIAAILADTDELQTDWANGGRLDVILDARASQASVDDLPTNAELATSQAAADDATLAVIATVDTVVDAIKVQTDKLTFNASNYVAANVRQDYTGAVVDDAGNSATTFKTDRTEAIDDYWKDAYIRITSGALVGQVKKVTAYNGTTKFVTVSGFTAEPADAVTFDLVTE